MSASAMSLKARIKNLAQKKNIKAQVLLQNYMFERFLERLSLSEYNNCYLRIPNSGRCDINSWVDKHD